MPKFKGGSSGAFQNADGGGKDLLERFAMVANDGPPKTSEQRYKVILWNPVLKREWVLWGDESTNLA